MVVLGLLLLLAGVVLLVNLFGAGDFVMRHVTSKYLGSLPPGYANTKRGFRFYAVLVLALGAIFLGVAVAASTVQLGLILIFLGVVAFAVTSVMAIRGEAETARGKKS